MRHLRLLLLVCLIPCLSSISIGQTPLAVWHFNETAGLQAQETMGGTAFAVRNDYPKQQAEWLPAASANGLRFNGYATWVEGTLTTAMPAQQVTISAWVAPEVWPMNTAAFFTNVNLSGGGAYLAVDKFGRMEVGATVNGFFTKKTSAQKIPLWQWSYVVLTVDGAAGKMRGYLNGILVLEQNTPTGLLNWAAPNAVKIGKFHNQTLSGIYETGLFCGLIDEVKIYDTALSQDELATIFSSENPSSPPNMAVPASRFDGDLHRPIFHAIPAANWMNEPHGLIFHNGLYHIFYQKNGNGPYWGRLNWGHQTSPDLVTWTEQKVVLSPDPDGYDKEGCWSGVSFSDGGKAYIMYTGVDGATAQMCLAESNADASEYQKLTANPVVLAPPAPYTSNDFRDPFIWQENGIFYMIIGTGNSTGGAALLYKSTDHLTWQYLYPLKKGVQATDQSGVFWEVPMFLNFGGKRVFTAQPVPYNGVPARILYWTGSFENEFFTADQTPPKQLEPGDALLGVTTTTDAAGRTIAIGIIPDILPGVEQRKNGWANLMSLPRVWSLSTDGTTLLQKPLPELDKLRGANHHFDHLEAAAGQTNLLPGIEGRHIEIRTTMDPGMASKAGIVVAKSADGTERTRIYWDVVAGILVVDRTHSSIHSNAPKSFLTANLSQAPGQPLDLHIFLDGSVLEVFINHETALSTRIYPEKPGSIGLDLFAEGGTATFQHLDIWDMKSMLDPTVQVSETPEFLKKNAIEKVFPNPTTGAFWVGVNLPQAGNVTARLLNVLGKTVAVQSFGKMGAGSATLAFRENTLPAGAYFLQILADSKVVGSSTVVRQ